MTTCLVGKCCVATKASGRSRRWREDIVTPITFLTVLLAASIVACQGSGAARATVAPGPATNRPLPEAPCVAEDNQKLYALVHQFVSAWNAHDGKRLDGLFAPDGWFALSSDPRHRQMVTVSGRNLDQTVKVYWAAGATLQYAQVLPPNPKPGDTRVGTEVDGLTIHFSDGTEIRTSNKFVVWCNYHALGQGVLFPLS